MTGDFVRAVSDILTPSPRTPKPNTPQNNETAAADARKKRHRWRLFLLFLLVVGPTAFGVLNLPSTQEAPPLVGPSIAVQASKQDVTVLVNMVLSAGVGLDGQSSQLTLAVQPVSGTDLPFTLTAELDDFPVGTTGVSGVPQALPLIGAPANNVYSSTAEAAPKTPPGYQDYKVTEDITTTTPPPVIFMAPNAQFGDTTAGAQLRVVFPDLAGEAPGANPSAAYPSGSLYSGGGAQGSSSSSPKTYPLALQAGTSWFMPGGIVLSNYQILAGDSPIPLGNDWRWVGVNDVNVLAANVQSEDTAQTIQFYGGVAFGLAAGAATAFLVELFWDRPEEKKPGPPPASDAPTPAQ